MRYALTTASGYWTTLAVGDPYPEHLDCGTRLDSLAEGAWRCPECGVTGGLLKPTNPNQSSAFYRTLLEAASWRLASDLVLRHPHLRVYRTFPHPGTSDVLMIVPNGHGPHRPKGPVIFLNRDHGRIHVLKRADGMEVEDGPWTWDEYLTTDSAPLIDRIEYAAGLWQGHENQPPSTEGLVYSLIARLASLALMEDVPSEIGQGYIDQWDSADWWPEMKTRNPELTEPRSDDLVGEPGFRFWRIERDDFSLTIETSTGTIWQSEYDADEVELLGYDEGEVPLADRLFPPGNRDALATALEVGEL